MDKSYDIHTGFHGLDLLEKIKSALTSKRLLIIANPLVDLKFLEKVTPPESALFGVFTSGTLTGKPRLIFYSLKNVQASLASIRALFDTKKLDGIFCYPQPTHTFGLTLGYIHAALYNLPLSFFDGAYSQLAHEKWMASQSPGLMTLGTPVHFKDLVAWVKKNKIEAGPTYTAIIGGAPTSVQLWNQVQSDLKIQAPSVGYGATEASPGITHLSPGTPPSEDGDIGSVLNGVEISELSNTGFYFSGANLCTAIYEEGALYYPERVLMKDHLMLRSGDRFTFGGRSDLLLNRGGIKISPELLEARIFSDLEVKAVGLSLYDERLGDDLAFVVQRPQKEMSSADDEALKLSIQELVKKESSVKISIDKIVFAQIPLNASGKYDRVESLKIVLREVAPPKNISVAYLKAFLPHRGTAVWIDRILDYEFRAGRAEVQLTESAPSFTNGELRASACIELVAQTFGYATAAYEIFADAQTTPANRTLIAEIRNAEFFFTEENRNALREATLQQKCLLIEARCTHDFGLIKVIKGSVKIGDIILAQLSMKAFVSA